MKNQEILRVENLKNKKDTYAIRWNITRLCNYYCDFCIQGNREKHLIDSKGETKQLRNEICNNIVDFIENRLIGYKNLKIYLIGGEITILPDFCEILEKLVNSKYDGNMEIQITTNLSCDIEILKKVKKIFKNKHNRKLTISASFYKEFVDEKEFMDKVKFLYAKNRIYNYIYKNFKNNRLIEFWCKIKKYNNINISVGIPISDDLEYKIFKKFRKKNFMYCNSINYIIIRKYKKSISDKLMKKLNKVNFKRVKVTLIDNSVHYFTNNSKLNVAITDTHRFVPKGMSCDVGTNVISIDNLGNISRCQSCAKKTMICNILDKGIEIFKNNIICQNDSCNCNYYGVIERKQNEK